MSTAARFLTHVDRTGDCWLWTGGCGTTRYGHFWLDGRTREAHRVSHELFLGPIPDGYEVDHLCRVTRCVRPSHLEAVSKAENRRRQSDAQTHCKRGHEFTQANTRIDRRGIRVCRACDREVYTARRKAAA